MSPFLGLAAVLVLVIANGFFVASEFSLVAVRRSRAAELVNAGRMNAKALQRAIDQLDANLAATQLGITISSLALGWIGEPALAHLIEPMLAGLPAGLAAGGSHAVAVAISFTVITALHIVLGELAPKSLALQRSERTALWVVRPLAVFLFVLRPAIGALNGLGNLVLRLFGLRPGTGEEALHSPEELKLLVAASHEAGLLNEAQQEVAERVFTLGDRRIVDIMTPRRDIDWIDADAGPEMVLQAVRRSTHEQLLVGQADLDELRGMILKKDLLDQALDGGAIDPLAVVRKPLIVHEATPIVRVLEQFKRSPVRLAVIINEYGSVEGLVTQTDLLEALAGELAEDEDGPDPAIVRQDDGSLLIDGLVSAHDGYRLLQWRDEPTDADYHTMAGFALARLTHLPVPGETFEHNGWRFEIVSLDGRRIAQLKATSLDPDLTVE